MLTPQQYALGQLQFARQATNGLLEDIPYDKYLHMPLGTCNHALWIMGHLLISYDQFAGALDGLPSEVPANYSELFGMGSEPTTDGDRYPPVAEVRRHFDATYNRMMNGEDATEEATP